MPGGTRQPLYWLVVVVLLAIGRLPANPQEAPPRSDTDARIEFYKARLGGAGTYPAYARLGAAYLQKARETGRVSYYDAAERHLLASLRFQRNFEALRSLAAVYVARHQFRQALPYAQEAVETMPADVEAQGTLFDIYLALGDSRKAAAVAERMQAAPPGFAAYARLASLRHYQGDPDGALEAMQQACAQAETQSLPAETRAWCQVRLGAWHVVACQADLADAAYQRAQERFPGYHLADEHLAELRAAQGRLPEAVELYRKLLARTPNPEYRLALADLYDALKQKRRARRERQRALADLRDSVEKGSRLFLRPLALVLLQQQQTAAEGLRWAQQDWDNRQDAYTADTLAWAYYQNHRYGEARQAIEKALRSGLRDATLFFHAALIYSRLGEPSPAHVFAEKALACPLALRPTDRVQAKKILAEPPRTPKRQQDAEKNYPR